MNSWLLVSSAVGLLAIAFVEFLRINKMVSNETSRKTLHIAHGLVVVAWVFVATLSFIVMAEILFLALVLLARYMGFMQPMRDVDRKSWGEIYFALGVIAAALLAPTTEIFIAAILHLALADALASLVGRRFKRGVYFIFGHRKTVAGTTVFFITSCMIIFGLMRYGTDVYAPAMLLLIPVISALAENFSPYGSDNLTVTLAVLGILSAAAA